MALIIGIVAVLIIIFGFLCYKKAPPTEAIVVTGFGLSKPKVVSGKGTFVLPVLQRADKLNMRLLKIDVKTPETGVKTQNGVSLWIDSVVTIQVYSENSTVLDDEVKASGLKDAKAYIMSEEIKKDSVSPAEEPKDEFETKLDTPSEDTPSEFETALTPEPQKPAEEDAEETPADTAEEPAADSEEDDLEKAEFVSPTFKGFKPPKLEDADEEENEAEEAAPEEDDEEPAPVAVKKKKTSTGSNVVLGVSCVVLVAAVGVMGMTMLKDNDANKTNIPSIGSAFSVGGDAQADTSFSEQAAVSPVTAITSNGRNWKLNASNVLIQGEDGSQAAVAVDAPDAFQYDGKSLSFELDGATYIVRMVSDTYEGGVQYAKEVTSETVTVSGMRSVGNGQVLVVVGTRPASDAQDVNDAVQTVVSSVLESAAPASDVGVVTFNGVSVSADGYDVSFSNSEAVLKAGDSEVKFTPSSYQADAIEFGDAGTSASGAAVTHGDYADANGTEAYLIESDDGNVMAFTNSSDMLTAVLGLQ